MFTGIVQEIGRVLDRRERDGIVELTIESRTCLPQLEHGDSVAVQGCCQTVTTQSEHAFQIDVMPQTIRMTTLGSLDVGDAVNLECSLRAGDRLGGHWVQGHVDGVGEVVEVLDQSGDWRVRIRPPAELVRYFAARGSVSVDGVSLTIAESDSESLVVALIPTTLQETTAGSYRPGTRVNIEVDILARYLERLMQESGTPSPGGSG